MVAEVRDAVILRVVSGRVPPGQLDAVADAYRRDYVPVASATEGLERFLVGARAIASGHALAAMTLWSSIEAALEAYGGNLTAVRTLDDASHGERLTRVDYYEVDTGTELHRPDVEARFLRLTAGRVARGLDADIQQELRRNLPTLEPEAVDAWIGRRVLGADVQIAFASTWSAVPENRSLEDPIWPAISGRYDEFRVEVHEIVLQGAGRP